MESFEAVARSAVTEAGAHLRRAWGQSKVVRYKGAVNLVTETDHALEALIVGRLRAAFPDHRIVAEEGSTGADATSRDDHVWYLDPLDGTTNFAHDFPHFAISLALARGAEIILGIVHDPIRDETFFATEGGGATLNGEPIHVSAVGDLDRALLATGFPYDRREHTDFYLGFVADFMRRTQGIRRTGSAALDLCYVACGRLDGMWEWKLSPWDIAAGTCIVREAGGTVTDFIGGPLDLFGTQTLASNRHLHSALTEVLRPRVEARP
ncbi:MAG TPA: inositol monophosphatase family protein, partial [Casimicrobiaceae bacterium]|nr:inositol monophosphatase family protein [Casimicrobiaceae bacterium]